MSSVYTPELETAIKALAVNGPITFSAAEAFATANGLKIRSVVAKVRSMKLAYTPKETKVTKAGEPVVLKQTIAQSIETALKVSLPSLVKMSKEDLEELAAAVSK